ncbi:hypothetical protein V6O07_16925, partial [Arthrospira platensis SPKY2]
MFNTVFGLNFLRDDRQLIDLGPGSQPKLTLADTTLICRGNSGNNAGNSGNNTGNPGNNIHTVVFHAIAALLNAAFYGERYPAVGYQLPEDVIAKFRDAALSL